MAILPVSCPPISSSESTKILLKKPAKSASIHSHRKQVLFSAYLPHQAVVTRARFRGEENEEGDEQSYSFDEAVMLFNRREYYKCHDVLEALWNDAEEPTRTLLHGVLQCAVSFHHLFNQGAMMELGEGVCKLRKMNFKNGPFHQFEQEVSQVLEFIYQTQLEHAACTSETCVTMDETEGSYKLLGEYGGGVRLYHLEIDQNWNAYIVFCPEKYQGTECEPPSVKIPVLRASEQDIFRLV